MPTVDVPLRGAHLLHDVLAAAVAARLAGAGSEAVRDGVASFGGVAHRLESLGTQGGVEYVNDSQATIPVAAIAGLEAFGERPVVVIAGGQGKGLTYEALADAMVAHCRAAVLIGETAAELESAGRRAGADRARGDHGRGGRRGDLAGPPRGRRAPRARRGELRHVRGLRRARRCLPGRRSAALPEAPGDGPMTATLT